MKTTLRLLACSLVACALTACPETKIGADFGYKPAVLLPADWDGTWRVFGDDDVAILKVSDIANGELTLTDVPKAGDKPGKPSLITLRHATTDKKGDLYFGTLREAGEKQTTFTPLLLRVPEDGQFIVWMIDDDAVAAAIRSGQLKGTVKEAKDGAHSTLASDPANYPPLIQPQFWHWQSPMLLSRDRK